MTTSEWATEAHAGRYLGRGRDWPPHRAEGEAVVLAELPERCERVLDLGCGDGRLLALVLEARPGATGVGLDVSPTMLDAARSRFAGSGVEVEAWDLADPLPDLGTFDAVVSSFAIHHCEHDRKRMLYAEVRDRLRPGGLFANLEHVASPTERLGSGSWPPSGSSRSGPTPPTGCSTSRPSCAGCASSAMRTSTATGSGGSWPSSPAVVPTGPCPPEPALRVPGERGGRGPVAMLARHVGTPPPHRNVLRSHPSDTVGTPSGAAA